MDRCWWKSSGKTRRRSTKDATYRATVFDGPTLKSLLTLLSFILQRKVSIKMSIKLISKSQLFLKRNAPTILTCMGGVGVVATTVMAVKATPKALTLLEEAKEEKGEVLTELEVVKTIAPCYIPTILMGAATISCIFGANILNKRQQASLASAYALLSTSYKEYKDKVEEMMGEGANEQISN